MHFIFKGELNEAKEKALEKIEEILGVETCYGHEDIVFYESSSLKVENWPDIEGQMTHSPTVLRLKVVVFENAHKLSEILQNKLLKYLESSRTMCVFVTNHDLLYTVHSRCACINFMSQKSLPKNALELKCLFGLGEEDNEISNQVLSFYRALAKSKSLLIHGGLFNEKSPALKVLATHLDIIIRLIILSDIKKRSTKRSAVAKRYIGAENNETNLYQLVFELELLN